MLRQRLTPILASIAAAACSSGDSGTLQIVTGEETDTFTATPATAYLQVQSVDTSGDPPTTIATQPISATSIDLGSLDESNVAAFQINGLDSSEQTRVTFGATVPLLFGDLNGVTLPVFMQRVNDFARIPGPLSTSREAPVLADVQGEYVFVAGGSGASPTSTEIYDFLWWDALSSPPTLPLVPVSAAFVGTTGWLFAADGTAQYFDLGYSDMGAITAPSGGSFADIAGGATVVGDKGVQYIVGATRTTGAPTAAVLQIDPNDTSDQNYQVGRPTWVSLSAPRLGATATWISGQGLVVTGGSATAAGVEIVVLPTSGGTSVTGTPLPFAADPTEGAGATALSNETVIVAGGLSAGGDLTAINSIDVSCRASCLESAWSMPLPVPLLTAQAFTLNSTTALIVGNEAITGATHAYIATATSLAEVATKVPHTNARAIWTPVGSIALVGGSNLIETFAF